MKTVTLSRRTIFSGFGIAAAGALATLYAPTIASATKDHLRKLVYLRNTPAPTGPYGVARAVFRAHVSGDTIPVDMWYPSKRSAVHREDWRAGTMLATADVTGAQVAQAEPPLEGRNSDKPPVVLRGQKKLILYHPGGGSVRDDNALMLANLASHGFVVGALDDLEHLPRGVHGYDDVPPIAENSPDLFALRNAESERRVAAAAALSKTVIDALARDEVWSAILDFEKVAVLGHSFGGATSATLSKIDRRVAAVVNMDGFTVGDAGNHGIDVPYLFLFSGEYFFIPVAELEAANGHRRIEVHYTQLEGKRLIRDSNRPWHHTFVAPAARHTDFVDQLVMPILGYRSDKEDEGRAKLWHSINGLVHEFLVGALSRSPGDRFVNSFQDGLLPLSNARAIAAQEGTIIQ